MILPPFPPVDSDAVQRARDDTFLRIGPGRSNVWIAAALCAALALAAWPLDWAVAEAVRNFNGGHPGDLVRLIGGLGHGVTLGFLFLGIAGFYDDVETGARGVLSLSLAGALAAALRALVARPRPDGNPYSFPSAHAACAFATAFVLARRFPRFRYLFYLVALAVAVSRVVWLKHYPSDVLAGAALGILCGAGGSGLAARFPLAPHRRLLRRFAASCIGLFLVGVIVSKHWPQDMAALFGPAVAQVLIRRGVRLLELRTSHDG